VEEGRKRRVEIDEEQKSGKQGHIKRYVFNSESNRSRIEKKKKKRLKNIEDGMQKIKRKGKPMQGA
jgi:hypothetical protein